MKRLPAHELLVKAGLSRTHWGRRIIAAERVGGFEEVDRSDAYDWPTCACSKVDPLIPRYEDGAPVDDLLHERGIEFAESVEGNEFEDAAADLVAIERRAAEMLRELNS